MANNVDVAYRYLRNKGLSAAQAAGVIGSMQGESGKNLDPKARNPSSGAYGIAQWLGGRKTAAVTSGDIRKQLDHLWGELQGPERAAFAALRRTKTPEQAAVAWQRVFERGAPHEQKYDLRAKNARNVFNAFKNKGGFGGDNSGGTTGAPSNGTVTTPSITIGGGSKTVEDPAAKGRVLLANLIQQRDPNSLLLKLGVLDPNESTTKTVDDPGVTVPGQTVSKDSGSSVPSSGGSSVRGIPGANKPGTVKELIFNDGGKGFGIKDGQRVDGRSVYGGVWQGHRDHVHVAAGPNEIVGIGKLAQKMGLHVGENPHFGGVAPVHVSGSYHYKGEAIDVSGDPRKMRAFARRVEQVNKK